jgi:hypothetical protein
MAKVLPLIVPTCTLNGNEFFLQKCNVVLGQIVKETFGKLCFSSINLSNFSFSFLQNGHHFHITK